MNETQTEKAGMNGWVAKTLGSVLGPNGYIRGPFGSSLLRNEMRTEGIPVYEQQHAIYNNREFRFYIDEQKHRELQRFTVKENDLIISCSGTLGKVSIIRKDDPKGIISQALLILRPELNNIAIKFLYYYLTSPVGFNSIVSVSSGSVQTNIAKRSVIENTDILLPPLPEQCAIASVLSILDDKIDLLHRQNKTLESMAEALFRHRFLNNENGWPTSKLSEHIHVTRGLSYRGAGLCENGQGIPMHNLNSVYEGGGYKYPGIKYYNGEYKERHIVKAGDVIVANTEQGHKYLLIGYPAIVPKKFGSEGIFSQHIYKLEVKDGSPLTRIFLYYLLKSQEVWEQVVGAANGSTVNMLPANGLETTEFNLPPSQIINDFTSIAADMLNKQEQNILDIETLSHLRDTLLPKLISGEVRVRV